MHQRVAPSPFIFALCWCACLFIVPPAARAGESLIKNGSFAEWNGATPVGWRLDVGARTNGASESTVRKIAGPALLLEGDGKTGVWRSVSQEFSARPNAYYRIQFEARAKDLVREANQFDNCYVGLMINDSGGQKLGLLYRNVFEADWAKGLIVARMPPETATATVLIFLSKTGLLGVKNVRVEQLQPDDSFAVLVDDMDRYYSFFASKAIDWNSLVNRYRERAQKAADSEEFVSVIKEMLAELGDMHVWINTPDGRTVPTHMNDSPPNFNYKAMAAELKSVRQFNRFGFIGRTEEGFAVAAIGTLSVDDKTLGEFSSALEGVLSDAPGLILDLRANSGGNELVAARIASMLTDERRIYAKAKIRAGNRHGDLIDQPPRLIAPRNQVTFTRPIVCLVGPRCVSSGEAFAMMLKAIPHATLVGQPTQGASGNPDPVALPNGVTVFYSRWTAELPDGTPLEGTGVQPDVFIEHKGDGDPTFDEAVKILSEKVTSGKAR